MARRRDHAGPSDPFGILVAAGADPGRLHQLCAWMLGGAAVKQLGAQEGKRVVRLRRAEESRRRRFPKQLRKMAREVDECVSHPAFDPNRLLPRPEAKLTLRERMELPKDTDVRTLISTMVALPRTLRDLAAYLDLCLRQGTINLSFRPETGDTLRLAVILLLDYVEESTHSPRYQTVADLVNEVLAKRDDQLATGEDLRKLRQRNPRLRKSQKPSQV